jgi:hypothetical protein
VRLKPDLAAESKDYFATKVPNARVFNLADKTADMLKADLKDAGISDCVTKEQHWTHS